MDVFGGGDEVYGYEDFGVVIGREERTQCPVDESGDEDFAV